MLCCCSFTVHRSFIIWWAICRDLWPTSQDSIGHFAYWSKLDVCLWATKAPCLLYHAIPHQEQNVSPNRNHPVLVRPHYFISLDTSISQCRQNDHVVSLSHVVHDFQTTGSSLICKVNNVFNVLPAAYSVHFVDEDWWKIINKPTNKQTLFMDKMAKTKTMMKYNCHLSQWIKMRQKW